MLFQYLLWMSYLKVFKRTKFTRVLQNAGRPNKTLNAFLMSNTVSLLSSWIWAYLFSKDGRFFGRQS